MRLPIRNLIFCVKKIGIKLKLKRHGNWMAGNVHPHLPLTELVSIFYQQIPVEFTFAVKKSNASRHDH
jgi:hypothetical protein